MRKLTNLVLIGLWAAGLSGCLDERNAGATGVGNPTKGTVTIALQAKPTVASAKTASSARNADGSFTIRDLGGTAFTVQSSRANVGRIQLQLPEGLDCGSADETECEAGEIKLTGPWEADLLTGAWSPDPGTFRIPVGGYSRLDLRLEAKHDKTSGTDALSGHSMIISGVFEYAGSATRNFTISLDFDEDARFAADSVFTLSEGANRLTVLFSIEKWLAGADITACLDDGSLVLDSHGDLVLDKDSDCGGLEQSIKDSIKGSGKLEGKRE